MDDRWIQGRRYINVNTEKSQEYESPETLACKLIKTQELQYSMTTFDKRIMLPCLQENTGDITWTGGQGDWGTGNFKWL